MRILLADVGNQWCALADKVINLYLLNKVAESLSSEKLSISQPFIPQWSPRLPPGSTFRNSICPHDTFRFYTVLRINSDYFPIQK
jgi:hypothetical protein